MSSLIMGYALVGTIVVVVGGIVVAGARFAAKHLKGRGEIAEAPRMTCGCPLDGRPAYYCMYCDRKSCADHRGEHRHPPESGPFADMDIEATTLAEDFTLWEAECSSSRLKRRVNQLRKLGGRR
jgi:hypothetical protein